MINFYKRAIGLLIGLALISTLCATTTFAQQKTKIAGKMTCANVDQKVIKIGDTEGHAMNLLEAEGINVCTSKHSFMDGAQVYNISFSDCIKGNGPHQGYVKFVKEDDTLYAKWEGMVTTNLSEGGTPLITFKGTFSYMKGSGKLKNIRGGGKYEGRYISSTIYTTEWDGEYFIEK